MTSLIEFLEARFAEDEAAAQAATSGPWNDDGGCISSEHYQITDYGSYTKADGEPEEWEDEQRRADSAHMTRHDPARVLREVAAKRAILNTHQPVQLHHLVCSECESSRGYPCRTLKNLAAVWSDHPSFDPNWSTT